MVSLPEGIHGKYLEAGVLDAVDSVKNELKKQDFHVIHKLRNSKKVYSETGEQTRCHCNS